MKVSDKDQTSQMVQQYTAQTTVSKDAGKNVQDAVQQKLAPEEKVDLSSKAKEAHKARQVIDTQPDVRAEKVAELKARIEQGAYNVQGDTIAEKMVGDSLLDIMA